MAATSDQSAVKNIKQGRLPSVGRARQLCEELGLEFYVGPPRKGSGGSSAKAPRRNLNRAAARFVAARLAELLEGEEEPGRMLVAVYIRILGNYAAGTASDYVARVARQVISDVEKAA